MTNERFERRANLMDLADKRQISQDQLNELETLCKEWLDERLRAADRWAIGE